MNTSRQETAISSIADIVEDPHYLARETITRVPHPELGSLLMSDPTGRGDFHGDVEAVRAANMEDPHRKIRDGRPAVVPAVCPS